MAELPSNAPQMFQLPGPAQINNQPGLVQGLSGGLEQGVKLGQAQQALAQHQQELQMAKQQHQFEQGIGIANQGLAAYNTYGDVVGPHSLETFKKGMNMAVPGSVDQALKWDDSMGDTLKTASKALEAGISGDRPWQEVLGVLGILQSKAGKVQSQRMQGMIDTGKDIFNQQQSTVRQQSSQDQDTQRAYASHAQPLIQAGATLGTIQDLLAKKDSASDVLAKAQIEKLVASGAISQNEVEKLTASGGPFEKLKQGWDTMFHGTLDDYHRNALNNWIPSKIKELNTTLASTASAFPGASPAKISFTSTQEKIQQAKQWIKDHPNDPMASKVKSKLKQLESQ